MVRINTLNRCGQTLTIELMGCINKTEFDILYDCLQSHVEEGVTEVCSVANEVRSLNCAFAPDAGRSTQLGLHRRGGSVRRGLLRRGDMSRGYRTRKQGP